MNATFCFGRMCLKKVLQRQEFSQFCKKSFSSQVVQDESVLVERIGNITNIGINLPEQKNILNSQALQALCKAVRNFENDSSSPAAVIHGIGGNLCSGLSDSIVEATEVQNLINCFTGCEKLLVAAVTGFTTCFGFELALLCDLRVVEETAILGFNARQNHRGVSQECADLLVASVGLSMALDMILTGRNIKAEEAFEFTIANRIVSCGTGLGQSIQLAKTIAKFPQELVISDKRKIYKFMCTNKL